MAKKTEELTPAQSTLIAACEASIAKDALEVQVAAARDKANAAWNAFMDVYPTAGEPFRATVGPWAGQWLRVVRRSFKEKKDGEGNIVAAAHVQAYPVPVKVEQSC